MPYLKREIKMSYIATSSENQPFEFETILRAPMLQTNLLFKLDRHGNTEMVLRYKGVFVSDELVKPEEADASYKSVTSGMKQRGVVQQVAVFDVVVSYGPEVDLYRDYKMPLTEENLKTKFIFAPRITPVVQ